MTPTPPLSLASRWVCSYLRWRYGGDVYALEPPLGCSPLLPAPWWRMAVYRFFFYPRWQVESYLFERFGQPMRFAWEQKLSDRV